MCGCCVEIRPSWIPRRPGGSSNFLPAAKNSSSSLLAEANLRSADTHRIYISGWSVWLPLLSCDLHIRYLLSSTRNVKRIEEYFKETNLNKSCSLSYNIAEHFHGMFIPNKRGWHRVFIYRTIWLLIKYDRICWSQSNGLCFLHIPWPSKSNLSISRQLFSHLLLCWSLHDIFFSSFFLPTPTPKMRNILSSWFFIVTPFSGLLYLRKQVRSLTCPSLLLSHQ